MKNIVAIVGRPNVGKSTFFNRCIGARHAIVDDSPGVTRDRIYHDVDWSGHEFLLIDTGGLVFDAKAEFANEVLAQVNLAIAEADVIIFMVDGKNGLHGNDQEVANLLRKSKKPVLLAVNKIDEPKEKDNSAEFYELGLGEPHGLSALRGSGGVGDLLDKIVEFFPQEKKKSKNGKKEHEFFEEELKEETEEDKGPLAIAIVGRPNVGKSSMINFLCGKERTIVSDIPGTTRDAIDTTITFEGREFTLIDTAGIRRKNKVDYGIEAFSVVRSIKSIGRADVTAVMLDANEEITEQDQKIASKIEEAGKAAVIVLNKWDLIENKTSKLMNDTTKKIKEELRSLAFAEVLFVSALTHQRASKILEAAVRAYEQTKRRISTGLLNQIVNEAVALVPPPSSRRGKRLRIYYTTQVSTAPPTFVLFANDGALMTRNYEVYLERKLREAFGFIGSPIRLITRSKRD